MNRGVRFLRLLTVSLWVGGIAFFAFAVAPVAFGRLPSAHEAGLVVGGTLRVLHLLGLGCGAIFLLFTGVAFRRLQSRRLVFAEILLNLLMLAFTAYSQFALLPAMETSRAQAGGDIATEAETNPGRVEFERLHRMSERLEGVILVCGLGLIFGLASESMVDTRGTEA